MFKPLLLLIFAPPSPDGGTGRRARLKIWLSQGSAGSIPVLGTKARVSAGLSVKEQNILTLKLKLTLFLGVKEQHILTLKLKLTLFFGVWV